ncbi:MAG TPA: hypothetical protein VFD71_20350 [Planctomycetota bacterium]|nr:hypothetical protein [Planctomycetota bacterium]
MGLDAQPLEKPAQSAAKTPRPLPEIRVKSRSMREDPVPLEGAAHPDDVPSEARAAVTPLEPVWRTGKKKGRSRLRKRLSRYGGYLAIRAAHAVLSRLPWCIGRGLAWLSGSVAYLLLGRERNIALQSLTRVYGHEKSPQEIRRLTRAVFQHTASVILDWIIIRRWSKEKLERRFPEFIAEVRATQATVHALGGQGVVGIGAHCGNWELQGHFFSLFAPGMLVPLAKRLYYEKYNDFLHRLRTAHGLEVIYTDESARKMLKVVDDGKVLSLLCDQDLRTNSGVFVDFFGLPAYTVTFPVDIARRKKAKMTVSLIVREGKSFRVVTRGPYDLPETGDAKADTHTATQMWTTLLEEEIRKRPEQWSWVHPRWRTTPDRPRGQLDSKLRRRRPD